MSTAYIIYDKYANAINNELLETGRRDSIHIDAVRLALRLALAELAESTPSMPAGQDSLHAQIVRLTEWLALNVENQHMASVDLAIHEIERQRTALATYQAEIDHLQEDANAEVAKLEQQLAQLDADNAALIRRNKELADELRTLNSNAVAVISGVVGAGLPNGYVRPSVISNQQSPISNSMWTDPDMLHLLDDEAKDWWIGVSAGRHTWRTVPKPVQLRMVRHVLSFGPETGSMTMAEFDAIKPGFMPGSGSHTKTLSLSWQQLNDWSVEL